MRNTINSNMAINPANYNINDGIKVLGALTMTGNMARGLYHEWNVHQNRNFQKQKMKMQQQQQDNRTNAAYNRNLFQNSLL